MIAPGFSAQSSPKASSELPGAREKTSFWQRKAAALPVPAATRNRRANHRLAVGLASSQTLVSCGENHWCPSYCQTVEAVWGLTLATSFLCMLEILGEMCPTAAPVRLLLAETRIAFVEEMSPPVSVSPVASRSKDFQAAFGLLTTVWRSALMVVELG